MSHTTRFRRLEACCHVRSLVQPRHTYARAHPSPPLSWQSRRLYSSPRSPGRTWNSTLTSGIIITAVLAGAGMSFAFLTSRPLRLESDENATWLGESQIEQRYLPPIVPYTIEQATEALRWESSSHMGGMGSGVLRFDRTRIPSNYPTEDEYLAATGSEADVVRWGMWGVFDGHAGWETAVTLESYLVKYVVRELLALSPSNALGDVAIQDVDRGMRKAFLSLDRDIMDLGTKAVKGPTFLNDAMSQLSPAYAGSCALVGFYHTDSQQIKVACVGDSRAVLGRKNRAGEWEAIPLSEDQTGWNANEVARLEAEHPNEPEMIKNGRLLGLAVTRAFGDSRWKWPREVTEQAEKRFYGPRIREHTLTPPYLTAEPVITTTRIEPDKGDFVILATDGLWDNLSSEQAVYLVGQWLEKHDPAEEPTPQDLARAPTALTGQGISTRKNPNPNMEYSYRTRVEAKDFVVVDDNAATHLARNALGGGNEDLLCGKLTPIAPLARNVRDDITVQVIFFGDDGTTIPNY